MSRGGGWRSSAAIGRLRPSPRSTSSIWLAKNSGVAHANHLTPAPPPPRPPQRPQLCSAVYILHWCCKALLAYLFFIFFFNRRLSLDSRSHDQLFLPHFSLFYALLSVDACFIFLLLVFSFLKLAFWSCFANNRHAFVLFFSFERRRRG